MYDRRERTGYSGANSAEALSEEVLRYLMRVRSSVRIVKSRMRGVARRESYDREISVNEMNMMNTMSKRKRNDIPRTR
jgi:hypothetical protein